MDLSTIKSKLQALNTNNDREKVDFSKIYWRPETGKQTIRIVPSATNPAFPFTELKFHYGITKFPMLALSNFGKQDPVEDFVKELRKTSDKDNWSLSGKISPKTRIFAPVIVRGEEEKGVRLWGFGTTIYKSLLALAEDEDIGDYTDVVNGWDLVVEQAPGTPFATTTVRIKPKQTALSEDSKEVELWLKEQPDPIGVNTEYDYEFIKSKLKIYLDPTAEEVNEEPAAGTEVAKTLPPVKKEKPAEKTDFTLETKPETSKNTVSKFDELFN